MLTFRRSDNIFLLSEQIKNPEDEQYKNFIKYFGLQSDINPNLINEILNDDLKKLLKELEKLVFEPISSSESREFDKNFITKTFSDFTDLNRKITEKSEIGLKLNWDNFWPNKIVNETNDINLEMRLTQERLQVLNLYNFLVNFIDEDKLLRLLSAIITDPFIKDKSALVATVSVGIVKNLDRKRYTPMTSLFVAEKMTNYEYVNVNSLKKDLITGFSLVFMNGLFSSGTKNFWTDLFVHEMGHMIIYFFSAKDENIKSFGKKMGTINFNKFLTEIGVFDGLYSEEINIFKNNFNLLDKCDNLLLINENVFYDNLLTAITNSLVAKGFNFEGTSSIDKTLLCYLVALPSHYGRRDIWTYIKKDNKQINEYFAEAFAYWVATPPEERNFYWGVFNKFFSDWLFGFKTE